ncbi:MAG TPA: SIMPL domain-containing protein [Candidatus Acidoferrales bacterium]|nr:SIMPL domain-containing protein [Candidatus Acidoferrales bacterium]
MKTSLLLLLTVVSFGCQSNPPQYIAVNGTATVKVPVDYFEVRISIRNQNADLNKANEQNKALVMKMFGILKKFSITDSDFVTKTSETTESLLPSYLRYDLEKHIPGIEYAGDLILRNTADYDALFKELIALGNVEVGVYNFGSYDIKKYKEESYQQAVIDAKRRAELLLSGTGSKVGKIFKLLQDGQDRYKEYDDIEGLLSSRQALTRTAAMLALPMPNTFRKKYFDQTAAVTVIYEIE